MMREFKFLRRDSGKGSLSDEIENVPENISCPVLLQIGMDVSRPPLNTIQEPNIDGCLSDQRNTVKTPAKCKWKMTDATTPLPLQRTPDKHANAFAARNRFGWGQKTESGAEFNDLLVQSSRGVGGNGGFPIMTPRSVRTVGRANSSCYSENNSTQNTPAKSVSRPPNPVFRSKVDGNGGGRAGSIAGQYKGMPMTCCPSTVVNTVEVPHFDLKEDSSFWMEHNVQVLIRIRPLSSMEKSVHGYNRCLKQESAQTVSWVGQPETRFTFDNVACETVDQEMLFQMAGLTMVENCLSGYNSCMFAYGQTGSGKTYTMLGEIDNLEVRPSSNRGMTPQIFEFLFARIRAEEEIRRDERLQYNCKCSFLEIYNEQITDLLDSSSSNLLVREDMTKGVYVENLSEFEVQTVGDILKLLLQGSLNRKVAATNMNKESSRSHSVFTCVIESRWEKDSTNNLRFARLNLVDLAGSERQKTSGAEGERLKEAANINKSLSTLGHVIMLLLDVAQGKPKHIPYRDSRLTFLLQDSLGGNSKTMIIANVSPSIGCAAETLNTLKFAQRAKFIQNNAVVNEDSSGDVTTLKHQICLLKEELSILKRQNISRSLSFGQPILEDISLMLEDEQNDDALVRSESGGIVRISSKQFKSLEATLAGALRREQMADTSIKQLEAEIEQLKRLVRQREEDTRCTKMTLRFREDKINRMESLLGCSIPADTYLLLENTALSKENELLQTKVDRNPEVTRFALENIRLLEQLKRFQDFYEEGEREILLAELSQLRDQLLKCYDGNSKQQCLQNFGMVSQEVHVTNERDSRQSQLDETLRELGDCRSKLSTCLEVNEELTREMHDLRSLMNNLTSAPIDQNNSNIIKDSLESPAKAVQNKRMEEKHESLTNHMDEIVNLLLELDILKLIVKQEKSSRSEAEEKVRSLNKDLDQENKKVHLTRKERGDLKYELEDAKSSIETLQSQQMILINKLEDLKNISNRNEELPSQKELELRVLKEQMFSQQLRNQPPLQAKLKKMQDSLETAKKLNMLYQTDCAFQTSDEERMDEIGRQAEAETAEVIVCLQEALSILEQDVQDSNLKEMDSRNQVTCLQTHVKELQEQICQLTQKLEDKDLELTTVSHGWELLTGEIEKLLADGHEEILDASAQVDLIADSFLKKRSWVSGQVGRMIRMISEKEQLIRELRRFLDNANKRIAEVESMLGSLRAAALAITEAHQQELTVNDRKIPLSTGLLSGQTYIIETLKNKVTHGEDQLRKVSACATAAFVMVNRLHETNLNKSDVIKHKDSLLSESTEMNQQKDICLHGEAIVAEEAERQIQLLRKELEVSEESCCSIRLMLSEEQEHARDMKLSIGNTEENEILNPREMLLELKLGVSTLRSSINMPVEQHGNPMKVNTAAVRSLADESCDVGEADTNLKDDISHVSFVVGNNLTDSSLDTNSLVRERTSEGACDRGSTIILLKKEIESAFETLKIVEAEMIKLHDEKQDNWLSEKKNQQRMKNTVKQVFEFQAAIANFEEQSGLKMVNLSHKLLAVEQVLYGTCTSWYQIKEKMEVEVGEAMLNASEKAAEAFCFLEKFAEAEDILKEADLIINKLLIEHEIMKFEIEGLKNEKEALTEEVQSMKSVNNMNHQYANLEKLLSVDKVKTKYLVLELEDIVAVVRTMSGEEFKSFAHDIHCMKSELVDFTKSTRLGLEDVYTEIFIKDCAVSVLHFCHTEILLETVSRLKAENGYLQRGLSESSSVVDDLREHNIKSRNELQLCRALKQKLLGDITKSFDRISRKEEAVKLGIKLRTFEKTVDLQLQEELMLQGSNKMGSELAVLVKDIDISNTTVFASVSDHENLLKETEEDIGSQTELLLLRFLSKDFQSLILESRLVELANQIVNLEWDKISCCSSVDNMRKEFTILKVDTGLKELLLVEYQVEVSHLLNKDEGTQRERQDMLLSLNVGLLRIAEMHGVVKSLKQNTQLLKDAASSNETLIEKLHQECTSKEIALELSQSHVNNLELETQKLLDKVCLLEFSSNNLQNELGTLIIRELGNVSYLKEENMSLKNEVRQLKTENCAAFQDLEEKKCGYESSLDCINVFHTENGKLQDKIIVLESCISNLQSDINLRDAALHKLQSSQSVLMEDLCSKTQDLQVVVDRLSMLKEQNDLLINELDSQKNNQLTVLTLSSFNTTNSLNSVESLDRLSSNISNKLANITIVDKLFQEFGEITELTFKFIEELDFLGNIAEDMSPKNLSLWTELRRKDDIIKGLSFDLSFLQESVANSKNQKDEIKDMMATIDSLRNELLVKLDELDEAVSFGHTREGQLKEKIGIISTLELELSQNRSSVKFLSNENIELRTCIEDLSAAKTYIEVNLKEKMNAINGFEQELVHYGNAFGEMNASVDTLKKNVNGLTYERDQLQMDVLLFERKFDISEADAEANEAIAVEAHQIVESRKLYAEEKEEEVKLLEKSVEELENTVFVLENKVDIVKGETKRQHLQREELELELHAVRYQLQNVQRSDDDMQRHLDEKEIDLHEALNRVQTLEIDITDKEVEISKLKSHISELNLHAEAHACEYKQKFKTLESMVEQVKVDSSLNHVTNSSSNRSEKNASKPRGSGSPFKCMGLGLVHQMKSEKDEELTVAKIRIEELEALAVSRQKEIFMLNSRLASAESMTHDVLRDLLEVKLDMTKYASFVDKDKMHKRSKNAQVPCTESQVKENEICRLKQQLSEYNEERAGWVEEIDRKHDELVTAQLALDKLHQREQFLKAENENFKIVNADHRKKIMDLEGEMKKLSGQQNFQQRIHHHAKIKEENSQLKIQNDNLSNELRRSDGTVSRVKEEFACYRATIRRNPCLDFDEGL